MQARRIVSLLPSATEIVYTLGLGDHVVGVSHSCDYPEVVRTKPRVSRPRFATAGLTGGEIDAAVRRALREHGSVYEVDVAALEALGPDLVLTQGICDVCAVPERQAVDAVAELPGRPQVLALDAHDLSAIWHSVRAVGHAAGVSARADRCVTEVERRLASVRARVTGRAAPAVLALEWLDPPYAPGHWVPELVELAGGHLLAGRAGRPSYPLSWDEIGTLAPDVVVVMPCGMTLDEGRRETDRSAARVRSIAGRALEGGRVYVVDAAAFFSRSGPRVVDGAELLGALLHPADFPDVVLEGRAERWG